MSNYIAPPSTLPPGSTVWAYLRDSGGEAQEQSTEQQCKEIKTYALQNGLVLVRIFEDLARSGLSAEKRPEFMEMIDLSFSRERPSGLLIWNYARFSRDTTDSVFYRAQLRRNGIVIHSLNDSIPEGDFSGIVESVIDLANSLQSKKNSQDVKRALAERVKAGYSPGGTPPRGYKAEREEIGIKRNGQPRIGTKWIPDPELAPLVKLAFSLRAEGKSLNEIQAATAGRLYRAKNSWATFFSNRSYLGIGKSGDLEVPEHHPALVDAVTFQRVQEVGKKARRNQAGNLLHPKRLQSPSLLSGLGKCLQCGSPLSQERGGHNKWRAYLCGKKRRYGYHSCNARQVNADKADQVIIDTILNRILTPAYAEDLIVEIQDELSDTAGLDRKQAETERSIAALDGVIGRILHAIETTGSSAAEQRLKEREAEHARLEFELATIKGRRAIAGRLELTPEALGYALDVWRGKIEETRAAEDVRGLQSLLRQFTTKIELGYNQGKIWYTYPVNEITTLQNNTDETPSLVGALFPERVSKVLEITWS